jgi:CHAT domain-containing protein
MSELTPQALIVHNQSELEDLAWELESAEGQFSLMLARCNYAHLRDALVEHLRQICSVVIRVLVLHPSETALYTRIQDELKGEQPGALMVFGLESVTDLAQLLSNANQVREEFRKNCPFPIVLWVTDDVMKGLVHAAPDLESWSTKTHFTLPLEILSQNLQQAADRLFDNLLDPTATDSFDLLRRTLDLGFLHSSEVEAATQELRLQGQELSPTLQASLDFAEGLAAIDSVEALASFERSLQFWQAQESKEVGGILSLKIGLLLVYIGRVKFAIADSNSQQTPDWEPIRQALQEATTRFEQANRSDLVALCIPQLERVLQKLQAWDELEHTARKGLELHRIYRNQTRLSQDYGFLARVMLEQQQWTAARDAANQALAELADQLDDLNWLRGLYRLFLAEAERRLENSEAAIVHLKEANARDVSDQGYPKIAIRMLRELRELHFDRKQYLEAFQAKQERLSIEQQYGIRAFVGAGWLRPQRQEVVAEFQVPTEGMVAPEITAAGRQQDLDRLIERVERRDYRLVVIHGNSGVGKSSLVNAGLVPTLKQKTIESRDNLPVVMRVYTQWVQELCNQLGAAFAEFYLAKTRERTEEQDSQDSRARNQELLKTEYSHLVSQGVFEPLTSESVLEQLRLHTARHLRPVLIFDQFEEFFFVYPKPEDRKPFFDFLSQCLQILSIKVFLLVREDYLHYLLECSRLESLKRTGIDILSQNVLYGLGNFDQQDAKAIIQSLTQRASFFLEPELVDQLVEDLAKELGEVRPIELQVVGAQLQAENITTLTQYQDLGQEPKQELVKRYLAGVVADCGTKHQPLAELVLFLLTDEKGTRPLKTRTELERELHALAISLDESDNSGISDGPLDLVLRIFVDSGLVFLLPEVPADRYQLVHDYLASFIRQQQEPKLAELVAELEKEREHRQQVEAQQQRTQIQLEQTEQAKLVLAEANRKAKLRERVSIGVLAITLTLAAVAGTWAGQAVKSADTQKQQADAKVVTAERQIQEATVTVEQTNRDAVIKGQQANRAIVAASGAEKKRKAAEEKLTAANAKVQQAERDLATAKEKLAGIDQKAQQKIQGATQQVKLAQAKLEEAKKEQQLAIVQLQNARQIAENIKQEVIQKKAQLDKLTGNLNQVQNQFDQAQQALLESVGDAPASVAKQTGQKPAIVYVNFISNGQGYNQLGLLLVTAESRRWVQTPNVVRQDEVLSIARSFRSEISQRRENGYLVHAQQLYKWIIDPLKPTLQKQGITNLVFILQDPALRSLPLAALHDGKKFLIENYSIGVMPGLNLTDTRYSSLKNARVLAIGTSVRPPNSPEFSSQLPGVKDEIDSIMHLWSGDVLLNQELTFNNLKQKREQRPFEIIHFAGYSNFAQDSSKSSFIQLWDRKLELDQLDELKWNSPPVELLALSAGKVGYGEKELKYGWASAAISSGVKSVLASLWDADDLATVKFMTEFYRNLRTAPIRAEALRQAQLAMLRDKSEPAKTRELQKGKGVIRVEPGDTVKPITKESSHPYYWAGFTIEPI